MKKTQPKKARVAKPERKRREEESPERPKVSRKDYIRAIKIIVELNEKIVSGEDDEDDPLWDELGAIRKILPPEQGEVIGRLALSFVRQVETQIDEATAGSHAHWK